MKRSILVLSLLALPLLLFGCDSNSPSPNELVPATEPLVDPLTQAGKPTYVVPVRVGEPYVIGFEYPEGDVFRRFVYEHNSSGKLYSGARTVIRNAAGINQLQVQDKRLVFPTSNEPRGYYQSAAFNQEAFYPPVPGSYTIQAKYYTYSPNWTAQTTDPDLNGQVQGNEDRIQYNTSQRQFYLCPTLDVPTCLDGSVRSPGNTIASISHAPLPSGANKNPIECGWDLPPDGGDECSPTGGGGPSNAIPAHHRFRPLLESNGPFFAAAGVGSSTSRSELENMLEGLDAGPLDDVAEIVEEAYGEDIYEYIDGHARSDDDSPFLFLTGLYLNNAEGLERVYVPFVERLRQRYHHTAAQTSATGGGGAAKTSSAGAAVAPVMALAEPMITAVGPNPARAYLTIAHSGSELVRRVEILSLTGRRVIDLTARIAESRSIRWDLRDRSGEQVAPGLYLIRITDIDGRSETRRVVVR